MGGDTENISSFTRKSLYVQYVGPRIKTTTTTITATTTKKNKRAESDISQFTLYWQGHIIITLVQISIHCESKMEKQGFPAGESRWQNSNSTTNQIQEQKTPRYELKKMVLNQAENLTEKQQKHFRVALN